MVTKLRVALVAVISFASVLPTSAAQLYLECEVQEEVKTVNLNSGKLIQDEFWPYHLKIEIDGSFFSQASIDKSGHEEASEGTVLETPTKFVLKFKELNFRQPDENEIFIDRIKGEFVGRSIVRSPSTPTISEFVEIGPCTPTSLPNKKF